MDHKPSFGERLSRMGTAGTGVLALIIMAGLSVCAFLFTSDMNQGNSVKENITFLNDKIWLNLLALAVGMALFYLLKGKLAKIPVKILKRWLTFWVIGLGLLWVFSTLSYPTHDSRMVTQAGEACARGDYTLLKGDYFKHFPFQLGYVFYSELMMRLLPIKDFYLHIQAFNILFLAAGYWAMLRFAELVFDNEKITRMTILLLALCLQPVLFSTFLYGTLPGLCCALWAVTHTAAYLKKGGWKHAALASLFVGLAVLLKQNYLIVLVAVCIILVLHIMKKPRWLHLGFLVMALVMVFGLQSAVEFQYEKRSGITFGEGIPIVSWAAMGLNEGYTTSGWYNVKYTVRNFDKLGGDGEKASDASVEEIKKRLALFDKDKAYTVNFFTQKVLSQWNEPTYQSIWTNQVRGHYTNGPWGIAWLVCGPGEGAVKGYMGFYQQLVFLCTAVALWRIIRKKELSLALFPLILLGGFLYHFIFEGKSQYMIPYFVMMIPLAAYGLHRMTETIDRLLAKRKASTRFLTRNGKDGAARVGSCQADDACDRTDKLKKSDY